MQKRLKILVYAKIGLMLFNNIREISQWDVTKTEKSRISFWFLETASF